MSFYLDTSVVVPLFFEERQTDIVRRWVRANEKTLFVSALVAGEFNSSVSRHVRTKEIDALQAARLVTDVARWFADMTHCVSVIDDDIQSAGAFVRTPLPKLMMPDAIHLAICKRLHLTLATFDMDLVIIAEREGVAAIVPA